MGLDMYLERMPRHRGATANDIQRVESYLDWLNAKAEGSEYAQCTFNEWNGDDRMPSQDDLEFYSNYYRVHYLAWDTEERYPFSGIMEHVGYWRKANAIHKWFVENIQDGEDDCNYHREVRKEDLQDLLDICKEVLDQCQLIPAQICNGYTMDSQGNKVWGYEHGFVVEDSSAAEALLPSQGGFFFGSLDYDEFYVNDIKNTIEIITKVLNTTDFDKQMIYYRSSW